MIVGRGLIDSVVQVFVQIDTCLIYPVRIDCPGNEYKKKATNGDCSEFHQVLWVWEIHLSQIICNCVCCVWGRF